MNTFTKKRLLLGFTDFLFFFLLLTMPLFITSVIYGFIKNSLELKGLYKSVIYQSILFPAFFISFIGFSKYSPSIKKMSFKSFRLKTITKALLPALTAFIIGSVSAFCLVQAASYLDFPGNLKEWIGAPNPGMTGVIEQIKSSNFVPVVLLIMYITIVGPIYEEILFRGFLQNSLSVILKNKYLEYILTALLFSMAHVFSAANALFSFCVGIILSQQKKMTNNIQIPIVMHSIINIMGVLFGIFFEFLIEKKG